MVVVVTEKGAKIVVAPYRSGKKVAMRSRIIAGESLSMRVVLLCCSRACGQYMPRKLGFAANVHKGRIHMVVFCL